MSDTPIHFEILTPTGVVASGDCEMLIAPGATGEVGFLKGHTPYLSALGTGVIRAKSAGLELRCFIAGGYIEFLDDKAIILAEIGEAADKIDVERAEKAMKGARARLDSPEGESPDEVARSLRSARRAYDRAKSRLQAVGRAVA